MAHQQLEQQFSEQIGLKTTFSEIYNPQPNAYLLKDIKLFVAGQKTLHIPSARVEKNNQVWMIVIPRCELSWSNHRRLWETLQEHLDQHRSESGESMRLRVDEVHFTDETLPSLYNLVAETSSTSDKSRLSTNFTLGKSQVKTPMQMVLETSNSTGVHVHWDTGDQQVALKQLAQAFPELKFATEETTFQGKIDWTQQQKDTQTEISGVLSGIELGPMLNSRSPHYIAGQAKLYLEQFKLHNNHIQSAHGWLIGREGQISLSLIQSAQAHLAVQPVFQTTASAGSLIGYTKLGIEFQVDQDQLSLKGVCEDFAPGTMIAGLESPLVLEPAQPWQPRLGLIPALSSDSGFSVPATVQSATLLQWLATPSSDY
ncbi:MAG: hypothetical protein COA78_17985 [Blastopirellula sp.]|nr:MAG: hypothetical protein COA78_17985 [Blastopirellula sp.]